ncbi:MAG: multiheme c-type cytochrome [Candidatus Sumerlaeota bacterium]|nr:multiheme c-type cytochrome [Candidatus Sumerlaeota bacterium]
MRISPTLRAAALGMLACLAAAAFSAGALQKVKAATSAPTPEFAPPPASTPGPSGILRLIYSGNRRSNLEPCGCKSNMQGGVQYEANYIASLRQAPRPLLLVDAGGFVESALTTNQYLKSRYLLKALGTIGYRVINVGRVDASFGLDFLREMRQQYGFEFVSATILNPDTRRPLFRPYVIKEFPGARPGQTFRVAITGFALPDTPAPQAVLDLRAASLGLPSEPTSSTLRRSASAAGPTTAAKRTPTPTPRVSPTPTERARGVFEPAQGYEQANARSTPTPPPWPGFFKTPTPSASPPLSMEEARRERLKELENLLVKPETSYGAAVPASASAPSSATLPQATPDPPSIPTSAPKAKPATQPSQPASSMAAKMAGAASRSASQRVEAPRPRGKEFAVADPVETLSKLVPALHESADFVIVLAHYPEANALAVVDKVPGIDALIASYGAVAAEEPRKHGATIFLGPGFDGRAIGEAEIYYDEARGRYAARGKVVPINSTLKAEPKVDAILSEYKGETKKIAPVERTVARYTLASVETCRNCHLAEYQQWQTTPHSRAFATLEKESQQYNPDCVKCHVTAYNVDNGFFDLATTPQFTNVQCEACHGPSLRHVRAMHLAGQSERLTGPQRVLIESQAESSMPPKTPAESLCLACHTPENDDNFVYLVKIEKVKHGAAAASAPATGTLTKDD